MDQLRQQLGVSEYTMCWFDCGAPVGYRLAFLHPERVTGLIVQNGNANSKGLRILGPVPGLLPSVAAANPDRLGKNDFAFPPEGAAHTPAISSTSRSMLDTGHFALETYGEK